jgi:phytoene synthase
VAGGTSPAETVAAQRAAGSSFYWAMRILPPAQRDAMFEIYAFCRAVDDIADSDDPRPVRHAQLAQWRLDIDRLYAEHPPAPLRGLAQATRAYHLAREDFLSVIDGMEMDVTNNICAPTLATLDYYCDCVASAVGRLSVRIFGMEREDGTLLAHHLGRALQLTNILRDLDEDASLGRLYLPHEVLQQFGIPTDEIPAALAHPALGEACEDIVVRARSHFAEADKIMARGRRSTVKAPRVMSDVYRMILERMQQRGWAAPRARVRIGRLRLLPLLLRNAII